MGPKTDPPGSLFDVFGEKECGLNVGVIVRCILEKKNTFLTGKKDKILRINNKFNLNLLIVYPNIICETKKIYKKNRINGPVKHQSYLSKKNSNKLIDYLKNNKNDLEKIWKQKYKRTI